MADAVSTEADVDGDGHFEPWPDVQVHVEWGPVGAQLSAARGDAIVIIDLLSFSTSASIAIEREATLFVYTKAEVEHLSGREQVARRHDALVVSKSRKPPPGQVSLSPKSLRSLSLRSRLLLTSANGAACVAAGERAAAVFIGALRNRLATAERLAQDLLAGAYRRVSLIPCGELWSSIAETGGWRPCLADLIGAGAIAQELQRSGLTLSAEAASAAANYAHSSTSLREALATSVSGRELVARGFPEDVTLASELDCAPLVVLRCDDDRRRFAGFSVRGASRGELDNSIQRRTAMQ